MIIINPRINSLTKIQQYYYISLCLLLAIIVNTQAHADIHTYNATFNLNSSINLHQKVNFEANSTTSSSSNSELNTSLHSNLNSNLTANSKPNLATTNKLKMNSYQQVGQYKMRWLWLNIYQAKYYTLSGKYQPEQYPQLLDIEYLRNIEADDLVQATIEQWQHLGYSPQQIKPWQQMLQKLWPDIKKNDHLSFEIINDNDGRFFYNNKFLKEIKTPGFSQAFIAIWLSENSSKPKLRRQLIGIDQ